MKRLTPSLMFFAGPTGLSGHAAEPQYGTVDEANNKELAISMENKVEIANGSILSIYGPGSVRKHPLTKEILVENRQLIAKAKVTANRPRISAKIIWEMIKFYQAMMQSTKRGHGQMAAHSSATPV